MVKQGDSNGRGVDDEKGSSGKGCCRRGAALSWLMSRPWRNADNYVVALQSVVGMDILFLTAWATYGPMTTWQGASAANTMVVIAIIGCKNVLKLSKPLLGDASKKSVINVAGTLAAGLSTLLLLFVSGIVIPWAMSWLFFAVFMAFYLVELGGWSYDFPMLFCTTLVTNTLRSLTAGSLQEGAVRLTQTTGGIVYAVVVVLFLVVFLFPRCELLAFDLHKSIYLC